MNAQPVLSRTALLVLGGSVVAFVGVIGIAYARDHPRVDVSHHVDKAAARDGVDLRTAISLRTESSGLIDIVAAVTIANLTDAPVLYAGIPCYAPARVTLKPVIIKDVLCGKRLPGRGRKRNQLARSSEVSVRVPTLSSSRCAGTRT